MSPPADLGATLAAWLGARVGAVNVVVDQLRRHAEGFSWQTYTLRARWADGEIALAIRREPEDGLLAPYDTRGQYELHRAIEAVGTVPVPRLRWLEEDASVLGMPFYAMDRVDGRVPEQWDPHDRRAFPDDRARTAVGERFVDALAAIHTIDVEAAGLRAAVGVPRDEVLHWEALLDEAVRVEVPLLRVAIAWLRENGPPPADRVALVHGDYRLGNFILAGDGTIAAVLDWELAHLGDPLEDLAWAGLRLFRGRSRKWSQLLEPEPFLARYEAATGIAVEPAALQWWTVLCYLRAIVPHLRAARAFEEGRTNDLRLAAMGHQALFALRQLDRELEVAA